MNWAKWVRKEDTFVALLFLYKTQTLLSSHYFLPISFFKHQGSTIFHSLSFPSRKPICIHEKSTYLSRNSNEYLIWYCSIIHIKHGAFSSGWVHVRRYIYITSLARFMISKYYKTEVWTRKINQNWSIQYL